MKPEKLELKSWQEYAVIQSKIISNMLSVSRDAIEYDNKMGNIPIEHRYATIKEFMLRIADPILIVNTTDTARLELLHYLLNDDIESIKDAEAKQWKPNKL